MNKKDSCYLYLINDENTLKANLLKQLGNEEFKIKNYSKSISLYTRAIDLNGLPLIDRSILYSNRCICYIKLNQLSLAIIDAQLIHELRPQWWKGYYRMAQIYYARGGYQCLSDAEDNLMKAESFERNKEISELLNEVRFQNTTSLRDGFMEFHPKNFTKETLICSYETMCAIESMIRLGGNNAMLTNIILRTEYCRRAHSYMSKLDFKSAMQFYKMAGERGLAEGYYMLAQFYVNAMGVKKDYELALKYYLKAAEQSVYFEIGKRKFKQIAIAMAELAIGYYHELGIVVKKDFTEAMKWYQRSFDHGFYASANNIGLNGNDWAKDEQILKCAAKKGDNRAMKNLAVKYLRKSDPISTLKWCLWLQQNGYCDQQLKDIENNAKIMLNSHNNLNAKSTQSKEIYLTDPYRKDIITKHRQFIHVKPILFGDYDEYNGFARILSNKIDVLINGTELHPKIQKTSQSSDKDLKSITMSDMNPILDHIYNGYIIDLKSIDIVSSFGSALVLVVEDKDKNVERCFIYNSPLLNDINKANKLYGIGCQFSVINPYMRMALDLKPGIRIDDINSIVIRGYVENMCRYCCESNAKKCCSRCKTAMYCSRECQLNDYKLNSHKLICYHK